MVLSTKGPPPPLVCTLDPLPLTSCSLRSSPHPTLPSSWSYTVNLTQPKDGRLGLGTFSFLSLLLIPLDNPSPSLSAPPLLDVTTYHTPSPFANVLFHLFFSPLFYPPYGTGQLYIEYTRTYRSNKDNWDRNLFTSP